MSKNSPWASGWPQEAIAILTKMHDEGHGPAPILKALKAKWPFVTRNAVIGKRDRMLVSGALVGAKARNPRARISLKSRARRAFDIKENTNLKEATPKAPTRTPSAKPLEEMTRAELRALPALILETGEPASVFTLNSSMCQWPIGDPRREGFAFCGRDATSGRYGRYCVGHTRLSYTSKEERKQQLAAAEAMKKTKKKYGRILSFIGQEAA